MEAKAPELVDNPNLRDRGPQNLKNGKIVRKIQPGKKIVEETPFRKIGVSRFCIREALFGLKREGIFRIIPRRYTFFVKPSQEYIIKILKIRKMPEVLRVARLFRSWKRPTSVNPGSVRESFASHGKKSIMLLRYKDSESDEFPEPESRVMP